MTFSVLTYGAPQDWQTGVMYPPGVAVVFGGTLWRCLRAHEGVSPVEGAFWTAVLSGGGGLPTGLTYASPCLEVGTDVANQAVICGAASSNAVSLSTAGSDAAVNLSVVTKGTGFTELLSAFLQIHPDNTTSSSLILAGATGSNPVSISAAGVATDIGINLVPKGSGLFTVNSVPVGSPGGSANSFQYNDGAGAFAGSAELVEVLGPPNILVTTNDGGTLSDATAAAALALTGGGSVPQFVIADASSAGGALAILTNPQTAEAPKLNLVGFRGTYATPTAVVNADILGSVNFYGTTGTGLAAATAGIISVEAKSTFSGAAVSTMHVESQGTIRLENLDASPVLVIVDGSMNVTTAYQANGTPGVNSGSFTTNDGKTVTVTMGLITAITP